MEVSLAERRRSPGRIRAAAAAALFVLALVVTFLSMGGAAQASAGSPGPLRAPAALPAPTATPGSPMASVAPSATAAAGTVSAAPTVSPSASKTPGSTSAALPLINLPDDRASSVQILLMLTILSLAPSILVMMTAFTRIIIVLSFVRNAIGVQQMPPNQVMIGLALFLTFLVMTPVIDDINKTAYQPYVKGEITQQQALDKAMLPVREFMFRQMSKDGKELTLFASMTKITEVKDVHDLPNAVVIPAFITSEIKRAFEIGFIIFIPFIVIDMIVSSTLMSMGMMMLPPTAISLPFKILLFVIVDGWTLTIKTLVMGFH